MFNVIVMKVHKEEDMDHYPLSQYYSNPGDNYHEELSLFLSKFVIRIIGYLAKLLFTNPPRHHQRGHERCPQTGLQRSSRHTYNDPTR